MNYIVNSRYSVALSQPNYEKNQQQKKIEKQNYSHVILFFFFVFLFLSQGVLVHGECSQFASFGQPRAQQPQYDDGVLVLK